MTLAKYARLHNNNKRSRKAAKNRAMYKAFGRRPWTDRQTLSRVRGKPPSQFRKMSNCYLYYRLKMEQHVGGWNYWAHRPRMAHLREPSGFKEMSRKADTYDDVVKRQSGCRCHMEAGDSPCQVHDYGASAFQKPECSAGRGTCYGDGTPKPLHSCPYAEEIHGDLGDVRTCCESCEKDCQDDI